MQAELANLATSGSLGDFTGSDNLIISKAYNLETFALTKTKIKHKVFFLCFK